MSEAGKKKKRPSQRGLFATAEKIAKGIWERRPRSAKQKDVLFAFYDLQVSPPSFDFVNFLILAEAERRMQGCTSIHLVIVPGPFDGFRNPKSKESNDQGTENFRWRLRNIVVPCSWLLPTCREITICVSRDEAAAIQRVLASHVFPKKYSIQNPVKRVYVISVLKACPNGRDIPTLSATPVGNYYVERWIKTHARDRKVITIHLRESTYRLRRNSNLKEWAEFAKSLDPQQFYPVFIRDTETALDALPSALEGLTVFPEAAWNIEIRAALCEQSYLNLMVNNGPGALCLYNPKTRYIMFKLLTPMYPSSDERYFWRCVGIEVGGQYPMATAFQRLVWDDDRLETIQEAFKEMCDKIEKEAGAFLPA